MRIRQLTLSLCLMFQLTNSNCYSSHDNGTCSEMNSNVFYLQIATIGLTGGYIVFKAAKGYIQNLIINGNDKYGKLKGACWRNFWCYSCCCLPKSFLEKFVIELPSDDVEKQMKDIREAYNNIVKKQNNEQDKDTELIAGIIAAKSSKPLGEKDEEE